MGGRIGAQNHKSHMNQLLISHLLRRSADLRPPDDFQALCPQARQLVLTDPYAFSIATCLDRGMKAEIIWTIPHDLRNRLGDLAPSRIYRMSLDELGQVIASLPRKPRFIHEAPRTIAELTAIVVEEYEGNAARIWEGRTAGEVRETFRRVYGVGPGIANMAVLAIEKAFNSRFSDLDRVQMDIKPDVHTVRVLYRLGLSSSLTEAAAVKAARTANPSFPGELDGILWRIGRRWCLASDPHCADCPVASDCAKVGVA